MRAAGWRVAAPASKEFVALKLCTSHFTGLGKEVSGESNPFYSQDRRIIVIIGSW